MRFRIRVDVSDDCTSDKVKCFVEKYLEGIAVHHLVNSNPHFHIYVDDPMCMSSQTMRMRIKRFFNVVKSTDYSVKECDDGRVDEYIQYLFNTKHGNVWTRVCDIGIDSSRIDSAIKNAGLVSKEYESVSKKKTAQITIFDIATELAHVMKDVKVEPRFMEDIEHAEYRASAKEAIKLCKKYRKGMDYNMIIKIMTTYTGIVDEDKLADKVEKYFSDRYR